MPGIDEQKTFRPLQIAILTVSDSRERADDRSGDALQERALAAGHVVAARALVPDDQARIEAEVRRFIADPGVEVVLATGGTGITGRDVTPEVFTRLYEKEIPGFGELFRFLSFQKIGTATIQSRASAGVARGTLLFCLPGSPGGCKDAWDDILVHQFDSRYRPCNFADLLPRLQEHQPPAKAP